MATLQTVAAAPGRFEFDPVKSLWRLLTSIRFALVLIAFLATASLLGILLPQLPAPMRGNPAAETAWLQFERGRFGVFTDPLQKLGLFEIFQSLWFATGLATLVVSVCVCTANRFAPVWRNVTHPAIRVGDEFFDNSQPVIKVAAADTDGLVGRLARRHYKVRVTTEGETTYVFADRFAWAQLATFVSHLALILFIAGGLVTVMTAKQEQVFVGEGASVPLFNLDDRDHMQVFVQDAVGQFDKSGFPLDYRTQITVYKGGKQIAQGWTTVNRPLSAGGFKFHQSAFFADGVQLQVKDTTTGRIVYDEVLPLESSASAPRIVVRDAAGATLLDDAVVPTDFLQDAAGTVISVPGTGREFWIGSRNLASNEWDLIVFETGRAANAGSIVAEGQAIDLGGLNLTFAGMTAVPSVLVKDLPGADAADGTLVEMSDGAGGEKVLTVGPVGGQAAVLSSTAPATVGRYQYIFPGRREFAGLTVRRDRGAAVIWLATGSLLLGLALTFYTPRRRLWGRITAGEATFRGLGGRFSAIGRELHEVADVPLASPEPVG